LHNSNPLKSSLRDLEQIEAWKALSALSFDWLVMGACLVLAYYTPWVFLPFWSLIIATRQHGLLVLLHEQVHFHFLKNQHLGEWISDFFMGFPLGVSTQLYRRSHFQHHEYLNTDRDPDYVFMKDHPDWHPPRHFKEFVTRALKDLGLLHFRENFIQGPFVTWWSPLPKLLKPKNDPQGGLSLGYKLCVLAYFVSAGVLLFALPLKIVLAWFAGLSLFLPALVRVRAMSEHQGLSTSTGLFGSRSLVNLNWFERFMIAPHGIHLHREHHENPRIAFYKLKEFSAHLRPQDLNNYESYFGSRGSLQDVVSKRENFFMPWRGESTTSPDALKPLGLPPVPPSNDMIQRKKASSLEQ